MATADAVNRLVLTYGCLNRFHADCNRADCVCPCHGATGEPLRHGPQGLGGKGVLLGKGR